MDDPQPKLLALLTLVDSNVLDVADSAEPAEELALNEHGADGDDPVSRLVDNDDRVVGTRRGAQRLELRAPRCLAWVRDDGENGEYVQVTTLVVGRREGTELCSMSSANDKPT